MGNGSDPTVWTRVQLCCTVYSTLTRWCRNVVPICSLYSTRRSSKNVHIFICSCYKLWSISIELDAQHSEIICNTAMTDLSTCTCVVLLHYLRKMWHKAAEVTTNDSVMPTVTCRYSKDVPYTENESASLRHSKLRAWILKKRCLKVKGQNQNVKSSELLCAL